jgi:hypothetical protein
MVVMFDIDMLPTEHEIFSMFVFSHVTRITSLVDIAVDRYIAILRPLEYPVIMTRYKAKIIISAIWVYHVILVVIPSMGWNNYDKYNGKVCDFFRTLPLIYTIVSTTGTKNAFEGIPEIISKPTIHGRVYR